MKFTKMQGLGNDYVYVNCFEETVNDPEKLAIAVSDRHFGIGSDGLILITPSEVADCRTVQNQASADRLRDFAYIQTFLQRHTSHQVFRGLRKSSGSSSSQSFACFGREERSSLAPEVFV